MYALNTHIVLPFIYYFMILKSWKKKMIWISLKQFEVIILLLYIKKY